MAHDFNALRPKIGMHFTSPQKLQLLLFLAVFLCELPNICDCGDFKTWDMAHGLNTWHPKIETRVDQI